MSANSSNVALSYSPMDFFYLSAGPDMPSASTCNSMQADPTDCSTVNPLISNACYQQALCQNKDLAETLTRSRDSHAQSDVKLDDTYSQYMNEYLKTVNLGVGIIVALIYIAYNK